MVFNIPVGGKAKAVVSVCGAANENVTLTDAKGKVFSATTDANGYGGTLKLPVGVYIIKGGHTEYRKSVTVTKTTTAVYAMPNGTIVYWYGYMPYTPVASKYAPTTAGTSNRKAPTLELGERSIYVKQPSTSGTYCGSVLFNDIETDGGVLTLKSSGKLNTNSSPPRVILSYASDISSITFTPAESVQVGSGVEENEMEAAPAGTYDVAISVENNGLNYHGHCYVYAVYFAE